MSRFDKEIDRTGTASIKWDRCRQKFGTDKQLIPLWIADTDFEAPEQVTEAIIKRAEHRVYGYTFAMDSYKECIQAWYQKRHQISIEKDWISAGSSVVPTLYFSILAMTKPGDKVLLLTPAYEPFYEIIESSGRRIMDCPLLAWEDGSYRADLEMMEKAMLEGCRFLLFCNPHNPVGKVWSRQEIHEIAALCRKYQVFVASDEIHGELVLYGNRYTSILEERELLQDRVAMYISAGKAFGLAGLDASSIIIPGAEYRERISQMLQNAGMKSQNIFGLAATQAAYEHGESWLEEELHYLEENSRYVCHFIDTCMEQVKYAKHEGTFLMWLDMSCLGLEDEELARRIVNECRLGLGFGSHYGRRYGQYIRMNIGCRKSLLAQAMANLKDLYDKCCPD